MAYSISRTNSAAGLATRSMDLSWIFLADLFAPLSLSPIPSRLALCGPRDGAVIMLKSLGALYSARENVVVLILSEPVINVLPLGQTCGAALLAINLVTPLRLVGNRLACCDIGVVP